MVVKKDALLRRANIKKLDKIKCELVTMTQIPDISVIQAPFFNYCDVITCLFCVISFLIYGLVFFSIITQFVEELQLLVLEQKTASKSNATKSKKINNNPGPIAIWISQRLSNPKVLSSIPTGTKSLKKIFNNKTALSESKQAAEWFI